jgi:CheY-like chemotaxis protein
LLGAHGYEVACAEDAGAALATLRMFPADVAVLDIGLPGMDGYALAQAIARDVGPRPRLVALTGYGTRNDRERALAAGFRDHLVKPVDPEHLLRVLDGVLTDRE